MATNTLTIQSELYKQLSTLNIPIYDYIPTDAKMPYIKLGYMNMKDYSVKTAASFTSIVPSETKNPRWRFFQLYNRKPKASSLFI